MRQLALLIALTMAATACTKRNPDFCCVTEQQCAELGGAEPQPCRAGQACQAGSCVASQCNTSADCTDRASPVCIANLCVEKCGTDDDCAGIAGAPYCAEDGACVGCTTSSQCPSSAAICDSEERTCRGCEADDQCASGVCIDADGTCAASDAIVFLSNIGDDTGSCTQPAPCRSVAYALSKVTPSRNVIRFLSARYDFGVAVPITVPVTFDGNATIVTGGAPLFTTGPAAAVITVEGVTVTRADDQPVLSVDSGSTVRVFDSSFEHGKLSTTNGAIELARASLRLSSVECTSGTVTVRHSTLDESPVRAMNSQLTVSQTRMVSTGDAIVSIGGIMRVENNVITTNSEVADVVYALSHSPGSTFRFNTVYNSSTVTRSPVAVYCDATLDVTSNIFAYNSTNPIANPGCVAHDSLFDGPGSADGAEGANNLSGDVMTFFKDRAAGDLHLPANSPALGRGQPGLVDSDFDGNPRPLPKGSPPDLGAFEAP